MPFSGANLPNKIALKGLLSRNGALPTGSAHRPYMGGYVVDARWADMVTSNGASLLANNAVDRAVTEVRAWNSVHPSSIEGLKVRIFSGIYTPEYANPLATTVRVCDDNGPTRCPAEGGPPCPTQTRQGRPAANYCGNIPRFWLPGFKTQWQAFVTLMASKYDSLADYPEIQEITGAQNTLIYGEPMQRQCRDIGVGGTVPNLYNAGYRGASTISVADTDETQQIADAKFLHDVWPNTQFDYTFNEYQIITDATHCSSEGVKPLAVAKRIGDAIRAASPDIGLENNSARETYMTSCSAGITCSGFNLYTYFQTKGGHISIQTAVGRVVGNLYNMLCAMSLQRTGCVDVSPVTSVDSIELPRGFNLGANDGPDGPVDHVDWYLNIPNDEAPNEMSALQLMY